MQVIYTADVTASGDGRDGHVTSSDGIIDFDVAVPKEMGGAGGATNPEQLFAAGYSACFHSALRLVSRRAKVSIDGTSVNAKVGFGKNDSGAYGLAVTLIVSIPGAEREVVQQLTEAAHQVCPYSNATRGNIDVQIEIA